MRIIIKNLPQCTTKEDVERAFSKHGKISDVFMVMDGNNKCKGTCFVGYLNESDGMDAIRHHDGSFFNRHRIQCETAKEDEQKGSESDERKIKYSRSIFIKNVPVDVAEDFVRKEAEIYGEVERVTITERKVGRSACVVFVNGDSAVEAYKKMKFVGGMNAKVSPWKDAKTNDAQEHYNMLFFNFEQVVKKICENERIGIRDVVDVDDKDLGARMARIETHLVQQTKEFLESNGIFLNALTGTTDKKTLVVRCAELMKCLEYISEGCRVCISPSKCLALLKFDKEDEALKCYRKLGLRRIREAVVYCEYAPICRVPENHLNVCKDEQISNATINGNPYGLRNRSKLGNKLLIRNVPFQATKEDIRKIFSEFHVKDVRIPIKREGSSRGFCFVTMETPEDVSGAMEYFGSSTHLYGRRLVLERAKI
ncbi:Multiple RNA-binding domain-containing protein 1 [Ordospora colligata]|uniref:RNA binding domain-containing protein n=1 Tax=Ordospora colligata OC4 TaxID=1354746 RepID=A0A0B2UIR1_9MICR|nr:RNA binding domain-containing protein [Ordospora colligata OC4]KHN69124.1 RNA binding domain-containing protein [Ordospora colligata OC4]TBU14579.1 RNA binding domain-containing protein [Ordospora colligata]TBU14773.1 RNA binding domain-containing protein [Ordospora colligata]